MSRPCDAERLLCYREEGKEDEEVELDDDVDFEEWKGKFSEMVEALYKKLDEFEKEIYRINKLKRHKYEIISVQ